MSRAELKQLAKKQIKGNIPILFVFGIIANLSLSVAISTFGYSFQGIMLNIGSILLLWLLVFVVFSPLQISLAHTYLKVADEEKPQFNMLGYSFKNCWGKSILLGILKFIFIYICLILCIIFFIVALISALALSWTPAALFAVFSLLFSLSCFAIAIIKYYSYKMSEFIMAENPNIKTIDAIREGKKMMKGHKFELFVLDLSFILWYLLVVITFGIASIYVMPYTTATRANFYLKLKEEQAK